MKYKTEAHTDIGTKKTTNQDALLIKQASSKAFGHICMACLCDGMGGLSCGEIASSTFIERMDKWFKEELPAALAKDDVTVQLDSSIPNETDYFKQIELQWNEVVQRVNVELAQYGYSKGIKLGTTAIAILIIDGSYIAMSVGDSRIYKINADDIVQLTHDQSYVQREIDAGRMTEEEAKVSDKKSVLLQCIGASEIVKPDFYYGQAIEGESILLCSDGFWRKLESDEIVLHINKKDGIKELTEMVKQRGETDNISGLVVSIR